MQIKTCYVCKNEKNLEQFAWANNSKRGDGRAAYCLDCSAKLTEREKTNIVTKLWRAANKERHDEMHKDYSLRRTYGIGLKEYNALLHAQNSVCAVCGEPSTVMNTKDNRVRGLCVDHNHKTGVVRALLCHSCNVILGHIESNPSRIKLLVKYLEKHQNK